MSNSIEDIWKKGFSENGDLTPPEINNLYNKKSNHIIDKFKRMFKINLIALLLFSIGMLTYLILDGREVIGLIIFLLLNIYVVVGKKQFNSLKKIDKNQDSYHFIKSFDHWLKHTISYNSKIARFFYPSVFLAAVSLIWFNDKNKNETLINFKNDPDVYMIMSLPVFWTLGMLVIALIMVYFSKHIYIWDFKLVYGRVMTKLDELIADMDELRK